MLNMSKHVFIALMPMDAATLRKPIRGRGGFQSLLRRLQGQLDGQHLAVSPTDAELSDGIRPRTAVEGFSAAPRAWFRSRERMQGNGVSDRWALLSLYRRCARTLKSWS
jgi:hypothetical protein